jgi:hypothetical protein
VQCLVAFHSLLASKVKVLSSEPVQKLKFKDTISISRMERRRQNWGTLVYNLRTATRHTPLSRSSPNLASASSRAMLLSDDDDDDYGFIVTKPPPIPPPPIPRIPLEFQREYQQRLKEQQNKVYWENIKQRLTDYYSHHHHQSRRFGRMSERGSREDTINKTMETGNLNSTNVLLKSKQQSATDSVPLQSSSGLDDFWISSGGRRDSGSTAELLDQVCEAQDCCERFEDFNNEGDLRASEKVTPLCVKCLVRYYNNRPVTTGMSRVS